MAVRYQHNNDKISSNYKNKKSISHTPIQKIYVRPFVLPLINEEEAESNDFSDEMKCLICLNEQALVVFRCRGQA